MLKIRLQRIGKRGQAYFKVIVTEHTTKPQGKYLELLGSYDPHKNEMHVDAEKIKHWLGQGAKMSETINNLLVGKGVIEGEKVQVWKPKKKKGGEAPAVALPAQAGEIKPVTPKEAPVEVESKTEETKEEVKAEESAPAPTEATPAISQL